MLVKLGRLEAVNDSGVCPTLPLQLSKVHDDDDTSSQTQTEAFSLLSRLWLYIELVFKVILKRFSEPGGRLIRRFRRLRRKR